VTAAMGQDVCGGLRATLGRFVSGVAVMTTNDEHDRPVGLTANSFTSVSLEPPQVLWCLRRASASLGVFVAADHFAVNVLAADQRDLARRFATPVANRFQAVGWQPHRLGPPVLTGTVATLICACTATIPCGDHLIVIGQVIEHEHTSGTPLAFLDGSLCDAPPPSRSLPRAPSRRFS
jgi:flavin reductase (DIM6/NTAB) family NADH-FMN oxidoreductase RutF